MSTYVTSIRTNTINLDGDLIAEFRLLRVGGKDYHGRSLLAFSDGTVLQVLQNEICKLVLLYNGMLYEEKIEGDLWTGNNDEVKFSDGLEWCIFAPDMNLYRAGKEGPTTVTGVSDDIINIRGAISEKIGAYGLDRYDDALLAFSDGTLLKPSYGPWVFSPLFIGHLFDDITEGSGEMDGSEVVTLKSGVKWCMFSRSMQYVLAKNDYDAEYHG